MTTTSAERRRPGPKPVSAAAFLAQMTRLVRGRQAAAATVYFDQHSPVVLDDLTLAQRLQLDELMEYVDTVTGWEPPPGTPSVVVPTDESPESAAPS